MATTQKKQTGTTEAKQRSGGKSTGAGNVTHSPSGSRRTVAEAERVELGPAGGEPADDGSKGPASIVVDPTTVPIGSPVRITATGTKGPIYVMHPAQGQTLEPNEARVVMATFQHTGEATVRARRAKGKGWAEAKLTII